MKITIQVSPSGGQCRHVVVRNAATNEVALTSTMDEVLAFKQTPSGGTILQQAAVLLLNAPPTSVNTLAKVKTYLESCRFLEPSEGVG